MNLTGTSQVWCVNKPGAWPQQVTFFKERISDFLPNPKRDKILLVSDVGGSEYDQFYLANGDGSGVELLTDNAPKVLYGFSRWSEDGTFFTFYSNRRSPLFYDVYRYNIDSRTEEMLYSSDHSNYPSAISPDGKYIVVTRSYSTYDNDIFLLNVQTRELKLISTHDNFNEPAEFYSMAFDKQSMNLYFNTNYRNDFYRLGVYNLESGNISYPEFSFLENYRNADVSGVNFSQDRSKLILQINDNGYDRLFMYDFDAKREIEIPAMLKTSSVTARSFANDNERVIIGINSASNPSVLYQWNYVTGVIEQVTYPSLAGIDPKTFVEPELISYKSFDGITIPAFLYLPKNSDGKKLPCIISMHGGPEGQSTYGFSSLYQYFISAGYAIIEPNVRGSTGYGKKFAALDNVKDRENSVKDIAWLVDYLKTRGDIDETKLAVYGGSYGGYMVLACLTLYPDLFAAGVDVVGIANFVTFMQNTADYRRMNRESEYGSLEKDKEFLESISPVHKVKNIRAPLMIIHGRNDPRVPVGEAEQMHEALINNGGVSELHIYDDEGHGVSKQKNRLDIYPKVVKFLDKYVKNK